MQQISPYTALQNEVDRVASVITDPTSVTFDRFFIEATAVLSGYGDQRQAQNSTLCAYGLRSLSDNDRRDFIQQYEMPGRVLMNLTELPEWPYKPQPVQEVEP